MGGRYLLELANWCRESGLHVIEWGSWEYHARGSGGYDSDRPWCIMWHHTASTSSPEQDAGYIADGHDDAPLANLLLARDGSVYVLAGGATNTNGKGRSLSTSRGTIPADSMNTYALGIEAQNSGVGQEWPQAQIDAYFALNNTLTARLGLEPSDCFSHQHYAPDRKIDPATADAVAGPWHPRSINSSGSWSVDDIRNEAAARAGGSVPPPDPLPGPDPEPPPMEDDDMTITAVMDPDGTGRIWIGDGITRFVCPSEGVFNNYVLGGKNGRYRFVNANGGEVSGFGDVSQVGADTLESLGRA